MFRRTLRVPSAIFDPVRLDAVRATRLLDTPAEEAFDRLAEMAGTLLDAPYAFVTLVDADRSFWKSAIGVGATRVEDRQVAVEESFCQYVIGAGEKLIIGDTRADPRTRENPSIEAMGVAAWAGYPVFGPDGDVLGTFCVVDTRTRAWTAQDERVLETLSESVSREIALRMAVDAERGARTAADALARSLQASLLPPHLPQVPGVAVAARYAPAGAGTELVGDFYDVFEVGDGGWGVAIGDVCGKGVDAAKVTALARYTLRTAAMSEREPARVLALLNDALRAGDVPELVFLTAQFGILRPGREGTDLLLSSAGHPSPLLRRADGSVAEVPVPGMLLGCVAEPPLRDYAISFAPGEALLLYTAGVTEARSGRGGAQLGEQRLHEVLAEAPADAEGIAAHVESAVRAHTRGPLADDMAVLVLSPRT